MDRALDYSLFICSLWCLCEKLDFTTFSIFSHLLVNNWSLGPVFLYTHFQNCPDIACMHHVSKMHFRKVQISCISFCTHISFKKGVISSYFFKPFFMKRDILSLVKGLKEKLLPSKKYEKSFLIGWLSNIWLIFTHWYEKRKWLLSLKSI